MNSLQFKINNFGADSVKNIMDDKTHDVLSFFQNIFGSFFNWLDGVFPPGSRMENLKKWIIVAAPYLIIGLVLLLCLPCLTRLFVGIASCFFSILKGIFSCFISILKAIDCCLCNIPSGIFRCFFKILCCCCSGGRKMMKAPGRNAVRIFRGSFESNPAGYFRGLRANQPINVDFLV